MSYGALMCHVVGAACSPSFKTPPRALPNVREHGTLPTDRALHVPNLERTPPPAIAVAAHFEMDGSQVCHSRRCREAQHGCVQLSGWPCDGREPCLQKTRQSCSRLVERRRHDHSRCPARDPVHCCHGPSGSSVGMCHACHCLCRSSRTNVYFSAWPESVAESFSCRLFRAPHVSLYQAAGQIVPTQCERTWRPSN